ncbi:MAG: hypothetical protein ACR2K2_03505 [Mycobacteriales bacterium]
MTATSTDRPGTLSHRSDSMSGGDMRRRGLILLAGAVAIVLLVQPIGFLDYYFNPLLIGLAFLAAAAATGPRSPLWGAALVTTSWGTYEVIASNVDVSWAGGMSLVAIGLGGLIAAYLASRGWAVSPASVAWPVVFIGVGEFVMGNASDTVTGAVTYFVAGLAAIYGVAELINSTRQSSDTVEHARN